VVADLAAAPGRAGPGLVLGHYALGRRHISLPANA